MPFVTVPDAVREIRDGRILVVVDDEDTRRMVDRAAFCGRPAPLQSPVDPRGSARHERRLACELLAHDRSLCRAVGTFREVTTMLSLRPRIALAIA